MKAHLLENYKTLYKIKDMLTTDDINYYSRTIVNKEK